MRDLLRASEKEILQALFGDAQTYLHAFGFMEDAALGFRLDGWAIQCFLGLPREQLGLTATGKPGDIDVLLLPMFDGDRFPERAMANEAKRFMVPRARRGRSPDGFGTDQVAGLVKDGFPLVGLLHIALVEPSLNSELVELPVLKQSYRTGENPFDGTLRHDPANHAVTKRHEGRMRKMDLPVWVGYCVQTLSTSRDGSTFTGWSVGSCRPPSKNPHRCLALLDRLRGLDRKPNFTVRHAGPETSISMSA